MNKSVRNSRRPAFKTESLQEKTRSQPSLSTPVSKADGTAGWQKEIIQNKNKTNSRQLRARPLKKNPTWPGNPKEARYLSALLNRRYCCAHIVRALVTGVLVLVSHGQMQSVSTAAACYDSPTRHHAGLWWSYVPSRQSGISSTRVSYHLERMEPFSAGSEIIYIRGGREIDPFLYLASSLSRQKEDKHSRFIHTERANTPQLYMYKYVPGRPII